MFSDVGGLEILTLVIMAIVIFGPDKLPKLIQDTMGFIKKVRSFADSAKEDIRSELGPEFKDFEFEDLHPKTFVRKQLMGGQDDPLGLKEMRNSLDIRSVLDDKPAAAVNGYGRAGDGQHGQVRRGGPGPPLLRRAPARRAPSVRPRRHLIPRRSDDATAPPGRTAERGGGVCAAIVLNVPAVPSVTSGRFRPEGTRRERRGTPPWERTTAGDLR